MMMEGARQLQRGLAPCGVGDMAGPWVTVLGMQQSSTTLRMYQGSSNSSPSPGVTFCGASGEAVHEFLQSVGLGQYADAFLQSGFDDIETLLDMEEADMKDIGIPRGHILKLRRKLKELKEQQAGVEVALRLQAAERSQRSGPHIEALPDMIADGAVADDAEVESSSGDHSVSAAGPQATASGRCAPVTAMMKSSVESSWAQVQMVGTEKIGELLFRDFFENAPETQDLFPPEVRARYRDWSCDKGRDDGSLWESPALRKLWAKVLSAIGYVVAGLHDVEQLVPKLHELGARHAGYGACDVHFTLLGKCLVKVLRESLGESFTPEVEFAWTMVYGFVAAIMAGGWQAARAELAATSTAAHVDVPALEKDDEVTREVSCAATVYTLREAQDGEHTRQVVAEGLEVVGSLDVYRVTRHLQKAIFGDVFAAVGVKSGRSFALKVLDKDIVNRFRQLQREDFQFCESPLNEVRYSETMRALQNVVQLEEHFSDDVNYFVVTPLATGGDLLEVLRERRGGFPEHRARLMIRGAARGLASLHLRGLAMQDVSLENMLLFILERGQWQVQVCDPGQAVCFLVDPVTGAETPVPFHGFVAKEFRPPELYSKKPYLATKVDAWCLGWSTFLLLCAQQMFDTADPATKDQDWQLFERREFSKLFRLKGWRTSLSIDARDFILRLMDVDPNSRMSCREALRHPWITAADRLSGNSRSSGARASTTKVGGEQKTSATVSARAQHLHQLRTDRRGRGTRHAAGSFSTDADEVSSEPSVHSAAGSGHTTTTTTTMKSNVENLPTAPTLLQHLYHRKAPSGGATSADERLAKATRGHHHAQQQQHHAGAAASAVSSTRR